MNKYGYRFSFGPWNIHEGADPFGPKVRPAISFADKLPIYQKLGFDAVQFHDDDAVPNLDELTPAQIRQLQANALRMAFLSPSQKERLLSQGVSRAVDQFPLQAEPRSPG